MGIWVGKTKDGNELIVDALTFEEALEKAMRLFPNSIFTGETPRQGIFPGFTEAIAISSLKPKE